MFRILHKLCAFYQMYWKQLPFSWSWCLLKFNWITIAPKSNCTRKCQSRNILFLFPIQDISLKYSYIWMIYHDSDIYDHCNKISWKYNRNSFLRTASTLDVLINNLVAKQKNGGRPLNHFISFYVFLTWFSWNQSA